MSKEHPTPWQVIRALGIDEEMESVFVADANNSAIARMVAYAENDEANAKLIVDAVNEKARNEQVASAVSQFIRQDASATLARVTSERDRLRDLVKRMIPVVEKFHSDALNLSKTIKGICALKGVDTSEIDRINSEHDALIAEARAAIGEDKP